MAVSDLTKELEKDTYKPDVASQKRIVGGLVSVLTNDTASEVRSCVIKWYVELRVVARTVTISILAIFALLSHSLPPPLRDLRALSLH